MVFKFSTEIVYAKPPLENLLEEYNSLLASMLVENINDFSYVASPVINRLEAQTHLYEKVEKYIQICGLLKKDNELGIVVAAQDALFYKALKREFGPRIRKNYQHDGALTARIRDWLRRINGVRFVVRAMYVVGRTLRLMRAAREVRPMKKPYSSIIRTYFDFRCKNAEGRLREEYFGDFSVDLARNEKLLVVYKLLHVKDFSVFLKLHKGQHDFDSCLFESFLTPFSLVKAFWRYSFSRISLKKRYYYRNIDITSLLQGAIDEAYFSLHGIDVFLEHEVAQKILMLAPKRLYFPYENQSWEKVYPLIKYNRGIKETKIIGFQHTSLSYKLIMHFPALIERDLPLFPDKVVTVGGIYQRLLKEKAHYPCEIVEGAALRHSKYVVDGRFNMKMPHKNLQKRIAYAFSYDLSKYWDILLALVEEFKDSEIIVYLKMHPDYDENDVLRSLRIALPKNIALAQKIPWDTIYRDVDCLLYDDNSIGVEGMINGVRTYMFDGGEPIYPCDRMFYFNQWQTSIDREGLKHLKDEIEAGSFDPWFDMENVKEYLNAYYGAYSKEKYFEAYL